MRYVVLTEYASYIENAIHNFLKEHHHRGEWFTCSVDDVRRAFLKARPYARRLMMKEIAELQAMDEAEEAARLAQNTEVSEITYGTMLGTPMSIRKIRALYRSKKICRNKALEEISRHQTVG